MEEFDMFWFLVTLKRLLEGLWKASLGALVRPFKGLLEVHIKATQRPLLCVVFEAFESFLFFVLQCSCFSETCPNHVTCYNIRRFLFWQHAFFTSCMCFLTNKRCNSLQSWLFYMTFSTYSSYENSEFDVLRFWQSANRCQLRLEQSGHRGWCLHILSFNLHRNP